MGRGEIWIGGPAVTDGYYKMGKQTQEAYMPGGYFATGDVGEWTPDGCLKIVDRKKNLVKLKGGEYVALENMETKFNNSDFVDALAGGIMVYAGGDVDRAVAFVQCSRKVLCDWATANGVNGTYEALLSDPRVRCFKDSCTYTHTHTYITHVLYIGCKGRIFFDDIHKYTHAHTRTSHKDHAWTPGQVISKIIPIIDGKRFDYSENMVVMSVLSSPVTSVHAPAQVLPCVATDA